MWYKRNCVFSHSPNYIYIQAAHVNTKPYRFLDNQYLTHTHTHTPWNNPSQKSFCTSLYRKSNDRINASSSTRVLKEKNVRTGTRLMVKTRMKDNRAWAHAYILFSTRRSIFRYSGMYARERARADGRSVACGRMKSSQTDEQLSWIFELRSHGINSR